MSTTTSSVDDLRRLVRQADAAYRDGAPLMSDAEFDRLEAELRSADGRDVATRATADDNDVELFVHKCSETLALRADP